MTEKPLNIYQRINKVMERIAYVRKESEVGFGNNKYKAVTHDVVVSEVRRFLVEYGIVIYPEQLSGAILIERDLVKDIKMHLYAGEYLIHFVSIDDDSRMTVKVHAHANDNGDKAPGKCLTYATKSAVLKVFFLETGENDESRTEDSSVITKTQVEAVDLILKSLDDDVKTRVLTSLSIDSTKEIPKREFQKIFNGLQKIKRSKEEANDKNTPIIAK